MRSLKQIALAGMVLGLVACGGGGASSSADGNKTLDYCELDNDTNQSDNKLIYVPNDGACKVHGHRARCKDEIVTVDNNASGRIVDIPVSSDENLTFNLTFMCNG